MALYLNNGLYLDWENFQMNSTGIKVEAGDCGGIQFSDQPAPGDQILDCSGKLIMKSFACGHHHVYSALARGMPAPAKSPVNFLEILEMIWWRLDKKLDREMIEASALFTAMDCAKKGVTFVADHHSSPLAVEGSLETIARAFDRVGVSHLLCLELSDRDGPQVVEKGLAETADYIKNRGNGLVGLHASFTLGDDLLKKAVNLAQNLGTGIHVHVAEDTLDQERCQTDHGKRVINRFADAGVLNLPTTILAHCLHLSKNEREILGESPAYIAVNTESNQNNNVGSFNWHNTEGNIMLGTDGMHSDMLRSAKAAYFAGIGTEGITPAETYRRFRNVHRYIKTNNMPGDGDNNLVILDYNSPTPVIPDNFLSHFIYGLESNHVDSVVSKGRLIVKNKKILTIDEKEILAYSREMAHKLWQQLKAKI